MLRAIKLASALFIITCAGPAGAEVQTQTIEYKDSDVVLVGHMAWDTMVSERNGQACSLYTNSGD